MFLYVTGSDLMRRFRSDVYDPLEGFDATEPDSENLWKNADVYGYMTEAADLVARRTKQLVKAFAVPYLAGQAVVRLPASVLDILPGTISLSTGGTSLFSGNVNDAPYGVSDDYGQRTVFAPIALNVVGTPSRIIRDYAPRGSIRFVPVPQVADTLLFTAIVTISYPFTDGTEPLPFTEMPDISIMLDYMKHLAYLKQDADVLDERKSNYYLGLAESKLVDRELELRRIRHPVSIVRGSF